MTLLPPDAGLQLVLEGETGILVRRSFAHPPARVWRALTEPALIRRWMAPPDTMTGCEMDLRPGGSFRFDWPEFHFSGPILEVEVPCRMVHVEHFNGDTTRGPEITTELQATGTGTRMTMRMRYSDAAERAAAIEMGMTDGYDKVYDRLADLLPDA